MDDGSQPHRFSDPKAYYHHQYFEACDVLLQELNDRFDQDDLLPPQYLENLLMKVANEDVYEESYEALSTVVILALKSFIRNFLFLLL